MQRRFWLGFLALMCVLMVPSAVMAQSSIAGQVKDESGGVLPGVTVEAASPALIEKTKSAVTDDQRPLHDRRPPAGHLQSDVHADRGSRPSCATASSCRRTSRPPSTPT